MIWLIGIQISSSESSSRKNSKGGWTNDRALFSNFCYVRQILRAKRLLFCFNMPFREQKTFLLANLVFLLFPNNDNPFYNGLSLLVLPLHGSNHPSIHVRACNAMINSFIFQCHMMFLRLLLVVSLVGFALSVPTNGKFSHERTKEWNLLIAPRLVLN